MSDPQSPEPLLPEDPDFAAVASSSGAAADAPATLYADGPASESRLTRRRRLSSGSSFEQVAGYSRAVIDGDDVWVAGTTGFDYATMTISEDPVAQTHQCFANIRDALSRAGCSLDDVVRVRYLLTDAALFERLAPIFGEYFAQARPAATAMVVGLVDPRMAIEIEVTARRAR